MTLRSLAVAAALAVAAGIAARDLTSAQSSRALSTIQVRLRQSLLTVHLAPPAAAGTRALIVYATGDGGWPGDERLFDRMMPWGMPMAGFNSVDYIESIDTPNRMIEPAAVARDLGTIIDRAIEALTLPKDQRVVVVGFSRGAGLAVAAATVPEFRPRVRGVIAVALAADETYVADPARVPTGFDPRPLRTYEALRDLGLFKVAIIQSTRDDILPAAEARRRFGPDTSTRRLRPIDARDHSFGGKLDELSAELKACLDWALAPQARLSGPPAFKLSGFPAFELSGFPAAVKLTPGCGPP
jgi:pimeloyl-ACP methyl ester carboxylesterase